MIDKGLDPTDRPTITLMFVARYQIPGNRRAILLDYKVGGIWAAVPDDRQGGVIWQAGFGQAGNVIHNLTSPKRTLSSDARCNTPADLISAWLVKTLGSVAMPAY
jgi:hypothetical protein